MHPLTRCLALIMVLLGCPPLRAQDTPPPVSVQFRLFAWGTDLPTLYYGANQKVEATENNGRSPTQTYSGPPVLAFTSVAPKAHDRKPPPVVASVLIPKDVTKVTLLTAPAGHGRYAMYVIPDDSTSLPPGHVRLHNLTPKRLMILCNGSQQIDLNSGASTLISGSGKAVVVQVATMENNRWVPLFNNVIQLSQQPQGSNILFIAGQEGAGIGMFVLPGWPKTPAPQEPPASP
ncbi:MAG: hypothetical protein WC661_00870 [Opitutaceae bacterium]|jgi:hypothetical protein